MPGFNEILNEISSAGTPGILDTVRRRYLQALYKATGRNVIAYYSGWLERPPLTKTQINDSDKNALMSVIYKLDRSKGLDLILHTPGGDTAATESIVHYLRSMFGTDIRAIIPQISMSAGTMIACSCKELIMGKHSNLGPIDPQFNGIPCHGVIEEFARAKKEIQENPGVIPLWQTIIGKYHPTFIGECEKAISLSKDLVMSWLITGMFEGKTDAEIKARSIVAELNDHSNQKTHARHISMEDCLRMGLKVTTLESLSTSATDLQDIILSIHHSYMLVFSMVPTVVKIIENHNECAVITQQQELHQKAI
jgi:hypothetical protein